jgi:hypothetical protein
MSRVPGDRKLTVLGAVTRGVVAGAVGTVALDLVWFTRYKRAGGERGFWQWDTGADVKTWGDASAPGQVGRKLAETLLRHDIPDEWARATNNVVHWAYGTSWGAQYGLVTRAIGSMPWWSGPVFASVVWLSGYVVLPLAKAYRPIWEYDAQTLAKDFSAHAAYGVVTSTVFAALARTGVERGANGDD